jgi:hypothetical protein
LATILTTGRERGFPDQIGREWLVRIGIADTLVPRNLHALVFLGITDKDGYKTELAEKLRVAPTEKYATTVEEVVRTAYARIFEVVEPTSASRMQVDDAFRFENPQGQRKRMVACFLGLCKLAQIPLKDPPIGGRPSASGRVRSGPEIPSRTPQRVSKSGATSPPAKLLDKSEAPCRDGSITSAHLDVLLAKFPSFDPSWPDNIKDKWFDGFARLQDELKK